MLNPSIVVAKSFHITSRWGLSGPPTPTPTHRLSIKDRSHRFYWRHCMPIPEFGFLDRIVYSKFDRPLIVFGPWTVMAALMGGIFHITRNKYTSLITDSISCENCTFLHFAGSRSRSTSDIWKVVHCFGAMNRDRWTHIYDISQMLRKCNPASNSGNSKNFDFSRV